MFGFRDVEIVQAIVRAGGFRAAAERQGVAQSAISTRVASLEKRLGVKLFDRVGRQVRLSSAGRRFLEEAERLVSIRDRMVQELTENSGLNGTVRIGVAESIVHTVLSEMLNRLRTDHPHVRFELSVETSGQLAQKLIDDEIDAAILLQEMTPHGATVVPLRPIELGWYAAAQFSRPDRPLTLEELARHPVITFPKGTLPYKKIERLFMGTDTSMPMLHGSASLLTVLHLVSDNFGIGLLPHRMVHSQQLNDIAKIQPLDVVAAAQPDSLRFALVSFPERHQEVSKIVTAAVLGADQNDL